MIVEHKIIDEKGKLEQYWGGDGLDHFTNSEQKELYDKCSIIIDEETCTALRFFWNGIEFGSIDDGVVTFHSHYNGGLTEPDRYLTDDNLKFLKNSQLVHKLYHKRANCD